MEEKDFEIVTESEERMARNSGKKVLVIIMRCLFGCFGVDKFIMGCKKKGCEDLITGLIITSSPVVSLLLFLVPFVGAGLYAIALFFICLVNIIRYIYFLITGIKMISLTPREIAEKYERMI